MKDVLEPLYAVAGVRATALVTADGVPIAALGTVASAEDCAEPWRDASVLAALCASWMDELARSVGKISWALPQRAVLRAARGTLLMMPTSGAVLAVVLERDTAADSLWLPMEGVAARIQRVLRAMGAADQEREGEFETRPSGAESGGASCEALDIDPRAALPGGASASEEPGGLLDSTVVRRGPEGTAGS